jgi:hypothetical protein
MGIMERPMLQLSVATMLRLVACIAFNIWLFRLGVFWGILGLNVTKHVMIAYLCGAAGVDRRLPRGPAVALVSPAPHSVTVAAVRFAADQAALPE